VFGLGLEGLADSIGRDECSSCPLPNGCPVDRRDIRGRQLSSPLFRRGHLWARDRDPATNLEQVIDDAPPRARPERGRLRPTLHQPRPLPRAIRWLTAGRLQPSPNTLAWFKFLSDEPETGQRPRGGHHELLHVRRDVPIVDHLQPFRRKLGQVRTAVAQHNVGERDGKLQTKPSRAVAPADQLPKHELAGGSIWPEPKTWLAITAANLKKNRSPSCWGPMPQST
jgi:hypothetical protein